MDDGLRNELLTNPMVIDEIKRHRWFESERAGRDVGYDAAAEDWLQKYSAAWIDYNKPNFKSLNKKENTSVKGVGKKPKRRSAKSYV